MDAYWAEGVDLSERAALERLAADAGVTPETVSQALDERAWRSTVDVSTARAQRAGATGVPAFVVDWKVLVLGAQPREVLAEAVAQARAAADRP
jgi:predicted DsbA family dithiol-disulfide isomerase